VASIATNPCGKRRIQFVDKDRERKTLWLGKVSKRVAEEIKVKVEAINAAQIAGLSIDGETAEWLARIGDGLHNKLARVGLVEPRATTAARNTTLGEFLDSFIAARPDHKPTTRKTFTQTQKALLDFFGREKRIHTVTAGDADDWKANLQAQGYAPASIGTFVKRARQMFCYAARKGLLAKSPFADLQAPSQANKSREQFVTGETTQKLLDAATDAEWRLLIALARYGGLRTPSESLNLRLADVNWSIERITVSIPKTEHVPGKESRTIPLFPELRPHLEEVFDLAPEGTVYFINRYRAPDVNLRTQLQRIIRKAGVRPWPRLWQNLRSSRETELAESFPLHVVTGWIGNTERIASKHYLQITDDHFRQAVQPDSAKYSAQTSQNTAQHRARTEQAPNAETLENPGFEDENAEFCGAGNYPRQESNL
jgi:integrase